MQTADRVSLWGGKKSPLPPGARWVEYLESTGTQWIDTNFIANENSAVDIEFAMTDINNSYATVFGARAGWKKRAFCLFRDTASRGCASFSVGTEGEVSKIALTNTVWHIVHLAKYWSFDASSGTFSTSSFTTPTTLKLFGFNWTGGAGVANSAKMRCRRFAVHDNNTLVRDFRAIAIGTTGYMLDLVSGEYLPYGNKGTGEFIVGPDAPAMTGGGV